MQPQNYYQVVIHALVKHGHFLESCQNSRATSIWEYPLSKNEWPRSLLQSFFDHAEPP